jgi:catechol 2,3-dioxygenase-like lactoylglutathione lyase family enzyme
MLQSIQYFLLGVADLDRTIAFYRDTLGLTLSWSSGGFAVFETGGIRLGFSTELPKALGRGAGATEVAFGVESVTAATAALVQRGVQFTGEPRLLFASTWGAHFRDPDDHLLSLLGPQ